MMQRFRTFGSALDAVDCVTKMKINRIAAARRPGDPDELVSENSEIRRELGWSPQFQVLDLIVKHALAWERKLTEISGGAYEVRQPVGSQPPPAYRRRGRTTWEETTRAVRPVMRRTALSQSNVAAKGCLPIARKNSE